MIADFVQAGERLPLLRELGCDGMQGCRFGKPRPEDEYWRLPRKSAAYDAARA